MAAPASKTTANLNGKWVLVGLLYSTLLSFSLLLPGLGSSRGERLGSLGLGDFAHFLVN